jgi:hypothetical protein
MPCDAPVMTASLRSMSMTILVDINREHRHPMARTFVAGDEVRPLMFQCPYLVSSAGLIASASHR